MKTNNMNNTLNTPLMLCSMDVFLKDETGDNRTKKHSGTVSRHHEREGRYIHPNIPGHVRHGWSHRCPHGRQTKMNRE